MDNNCREEIYKAPPHCHVTFHFFLIENVSGYLYSNANSGRLETMLGYLASNLVQQNTIRKCCYVAILKLHSSQQLVANPSLKRTDSLFVLPSYRYISQRYSSFIGIQELT